MKKVKITDIESCPKYFFLDDSYYKVNKQSFNKVKKYDYGFDIQSFDISSFKYYFDEKVQPITKAEFAIELNKAYAKISGFKHIEELWKDEEADTHNTEEIDLLSQCEIFIAGVQSYLGDDTTGKELLEKIKNYKKTTISKTK